MRLDFLRNYT